MRRAEEAETRRTAQRGARRVRRYAEGIAKKDTAGDEAFDGAAAEPLLAEGRDAKK